MRAAAAPSRVICLGLTYINRCGEDGQLALGRISSDPSGSPRDEIRSLSERYVFVDTYPEERFVGRSGDLYGAAEILPKAS